MDWVWDIFKDYVRKHLRRQKIYEPSEAQMQQAFIDIMSESTVTVLVQEPWQTGVRFKGLAKYDAADMMPLLTDADGFLLNQFGGGKFKLNFHQGMNFIGTKNFKPKGEPKWRDLPDIGF
ncbi:MAG: hypothetical protein ACE5I1_09885 [bacterium]